MLVVVGVVRMVEVRLVSTTGLAVVVVLLIGMAVVIRAVLGRAAMLDVETVVDEETSEFQKQHNNHLRTVND